MFHLVQSECSRRLCLILILIMPALSGCAVHYSDHRKGVEHLWGLGRLGLTIEPVGNHLVLVTSGSRIPGLCIGIGRDHIGASLGYIIRERLVVMETNAVMNSPGIDRSQAFILESGAGRFWGFGHLRLNSIPSATRRQAIITGKALGGVGVHAGGGDTSLSAGLDGRQRLAFTEESAQLEFEQNAPRWPGFDLFTARVKEPALSQTNLNHKGAL